MRYVTLTYSHSPHHGESCARGSACRTKGGSLCPAARLPAVDDDDDDDGEVLKVSGRLLNIVPLWVFFVYTTFHLPRL